MQITFERSGGFAGMLIKKEFDLDDLPDDIEDTLKDMLKAANFFALPARLPSQGAMPDSFSYLITVRSDKGTHTVEFSDGAITDNLRPLVDELWKLAKKR
jgi:hypothetical protein